MLEKLNDPTPFVEEVLFRYFAKYTNDIEGTIELLEKTLPRQYRSKIEDLRFYLNQGERFEDALYKAGLLNEQSYNLIKSAIVAGNLREVLREKFEMDKILKENTKELIKKLISPVLSLKASIVLLYMGIFKLYANFSSFVNLGDDVVYKTFDFFLHHPEYFWISVAGLFISIFVIFLLRRHIPLLKGVFLSIEKMHFLSYLKTGLKSGQNLVFLLRNYKGGFEKIATQILSDLEEGKAPIDAFQERMRKFLTPFENTYLLATFKTQDTKEIISGLEDWIEDLRFELDKSLNRLGSILHILALLLVASVIFLVVVKIYFGMYSAISGMGGG